MLPEPTLKSININTTFNNHPITFSNSKALSSDGIEFFSRKSYGKGSAILLNFDLATAYNNCHDYNVFDKFILDLLKANGIVPQVIVDGTTNSYRLLKIRENSNRVTIGLLTNEQDIGRTIKFKLPAKQHIYSPAGGYLGFKQTVTQQAVTPFIVFSAFNQLQNPPEITVAEIAKPGIPVKISMDKIAPGTVLYISLQTPDNQSLKLKDQVITVTDTQKTGALHFSFNDKPGAYILTCRDAATNLTTTKIIKLLEP